MLHKLKHLVLVLGLVLLYPVVHSTSAFGGVITKNDGFSGKVYLITVGMNDYSKLRGYPSLYSPESDAVKFRERLQRDSSVKAVVSWNYTSIHSKTEILTAFDEVAGRATPADAFVFFCASHSLGGNIVLPDSSIITANELFRKSENIYATRQLFFLDACNGEQFVNNIKRRMMSRPEESAIGNLNRIILAVKGLAFESRDGGSFTMSYANNSSIKMMDIFSKNNRQQISLLNELYKQLIPQMSIDFFSEKEFYSAVVPVTQGETRATIKGETKTTEAEKKRIRIRKGETLSLLIGCKNFDNFNSLGNTLNDAQDIKKILEDKYLHRTVLMEDPTFADFRQMLYSLKEDYEFEEGSQFLFFAATHGAKDENGSGVMVFKDSKFEGKFLEKTYSLNSIKKAISQLNCTNSLMLIDICHSGTMFDDGSCIKPNGIEIPVTSPVFTTRGTDGPVYRNFLNQKANIFIGSSTDQEAADGKKGHSPFATVVIGFLDQNTLPVIDNYHLQYAIQNNVMKEGAISVPMFCTYACKEDGRFFFIKR